MQKSAVPAAIVTFESAQCGETANAAYEHPFVIGLCHWISAVSIVVLVFSGWQIFYAFPSFGPKIPQRDFIHLPTVLMLGGWLGGGLQWHLTFMWLFVTTGAVYLGYQIASGHYRTLLLTAKDVSGLWPMVRYYFLFGPKPELTEPYNPLQKLAYASTVSLGLFAVLTGMVLWNPVQFSWLAWLMGGFHLARVWHFAVMAGFLMFTAAHLLMVALHGSNNLSSMLTGWKRDPEYSHSASGSMKNS